MTGIWVRPQIPGLSPGGLGPHLTSSGFPSGLSSGFPFAHPGSSPSSAVLRFPFRPAFSGSVPSAVAVRSGFPSASLRVPFPLSNAHASTPKGRFRRRWSRAVGTKVTSSRRDPWLRSARNTKCSPGADRVARYGVPAGRAHHVLHGGSGDDRGSCWPGAGRFNVLLGQAREVRSRPFGDVGTVFSGQGIEMVWVSKLAESIDQNWPSSGQVNLILVVRGQLKFEFESPSQPVPRPERGRSTCPARWTDVPRVPMATRSP